MSLQKALQLLGFRQQSYQRAFANSDMHLVLVDLAKFSKAFDSDQAGLSHDQLMRMSGRRDMFFRIITHLKLSQADMELVYQPALVAASRRIQTTGVEE